MPYTEPYDTADYLLDDEDILAYLEEAAETGEAHVIVTSLATVARARGGISQLAQRTGIDDAVLSAALSHDGNPDFALLLRILDALGVKLTFSKAIEQVAA